MLPGVYFPSALVVAPVCGDQNYGYKNPKRRQQTLDERVEMQRMWVRGIRETQAGAVPEL